MQHVEEAGRPLRRLGLRDPAALDRAASSRPRSAARPRCSRAGSACSGLVNVQFALHEGKIYVLEANPRASRTVPFVAKATASPSSTWPAA